MIVNFNIVWKYYVSDQLLLTKDPYDYKSISQGVVTVDGLDDGEELIITDVTIIKLQLKALPAITC